MSTVVILLLGAATLAFWYDSLGAREQALSACRRACEQLDVQLLDQTVAVVRLGWGRDGHGRLRWRRGYRFEFSRDGADRWPGQLQLFGRQVESIQLEHPDGTIILGRHGRAAGPRAIPPRADTH